MATPRRGGTVPPKRGRASRGRIPFWLRLCALLIRPTAWLLWRLRYRGMDNIPVEGGVIVVLNHISTLDPLLIARYMWDSGRIPRFMIKDSLWKVPVVKRAMVGTDQIPVRRGTAGATESLAAAGEALRRGEVVVVYPEGTVTRDPDFWPMLPRTGIARLALAVPEVPVIPIAHWGAHLSLDYHTKKRDLFPRKTAVVEAGPPVDLTRFHGRPLTADLLRRVSDECMYAVRDRLACIRGEPAPEGLFNPAAARSGPAVDGGPDDDIDAGDAGAPDEPSGDTTSDTGGSGDRGTPGPAGNPGDAAGAPGTSGTPGNSGTSENSGAKGDSGDPGESGRPEPERSA